MSVNHEPMFAGAPLFASVTAVTANTALDGTGTVSTILTAGADGCKVTSLQALTRATIAATAVRIFVSYDAGVTKNLLYEKLMNAYTVANNTAQTPVTFVDKTVELQALWLPPSAVLYGSIAIALAGGVQFDAEYRNLTAT